MKIFIGMECSGALRRRFAALGHDVISCDLKPAEDGAAHGQHRVGDVFKMLEYLFPIWWPDVAIFHPDCTYLTNSAAWAFSDPDFERYPGIGYHQKIKPETLTGAVRREAREAAMRTVEQIDKLEIAVKVMENPPGSISTRFRPADQIVQPYMFGDDASKATGLWFWGIDPLPEPPRSKWYPPRIVQPGSMPRWSNQTDSGQNRLSPGEHRATDRARTYDGIAGALVTHLTAPPARLL